MKVVCVCEICRKKFEKYPSVKKRTCGDKKCAGKLKSKMYSGEGNPHYNHSVGERECPVCHNQFRPKKGRDKQVVCSFKCFKKLFIGRRTYHAKGGRRPNVGGQYFRSVWEANYARLLNHLGIAWEYEPKTFFFPGVTRGAKSYLPDFYIRGTNEFVEIKGWMKSTDRTKMKRMAKYHPSVTILMVGKNDYLRLERQWSHKVPGWEYSNASQSQTNKKEAPLIKVIEQRLKEAGIC